MHVCVWAYAHECLYQWRPEGPRSPGAGIARVVSQLTWCWELNTFPLQGHYALLAAEPSCQPLILHRSYNGFLSWNSLEILKLCDMVTHARWYKFKLVTICFNNWQHPMNFIIGNIWEWETLQTFSNQIKHTPHHWSRIWRLLKPRGDRQQIHHAHHCSFCFQTALDL